MPYSRYTDEAFFCVFRRSKFWLFADGALLGATTTKSTSQSTNTITEWPTWTPPPGPATATESLLTFALALFSRQLSSENSTQAERTATDNYSYFFFQS